MQIGIWQQLNKLKRLENQLAVKFLAILSPDDQDFTIQGYVSKIGLDITALS